MFDQFNDIPYWLVKERLEDLERDGRSSHNPFQASRRQQVIWYRLTDYLGDLLTHLGSQLKHQNLSEAAEVRGMPNLPHHRYLHPNRYLYYHRRHVH